jgi:hypothetical protein
MAVLTLRQLLCYCCLLPGMEVVLVHHLLQCLPWWHRWHLLS